MNRTESKLEEARFFLSELERTYYEYLEEFKGPLSKANTPPKCQYYLSAFISSARSITWVMRSEYLHVNGWQEWYDSKKPNIDEEVLLKKMNAIRVRSEKSNPLNLGYSIAFIENSTEISQPSLDESLSEWRGKRYHIKFERILDKDESISTKDRFFQIEAEISSFFWTIPEFPDKDILTICKQYFSFLETIVAECKSHFFPAQ